MADDVYDDPDNILNDTDDTVNGSVELPDNEKNDESQSIYNPEGPGKGGEDPDREPIDELERPDDTDETAQDLIDHPDEVDPDSGRLGDMEPSDSNDGDEA